MITVSPPFARLLDKTILLWCYTWLYILRYLLCVLYSSWKIICVGAVYAAIAEEQQYFFQWPAQKETTSRSRVKIGITC